MNAPTDEEIMIALVEQVQKAAAGGSENDVVTFITRPMWMAFLRATGEKDLHKLPRPGLSVFGSRTLLFNREAMEAVSFPLSHLQKPTEFPPVD